MEAIIHSFLLVVASEMGDKTQLLALVLTSRFKRPWVIMAGILVATLLNHGLASAAGGWLSAWLLNYFSMDQLRWGLASTFFIFALWILIPDKDEGLKQSSKYGAFFTTVVSFFLAEMGDKTQLATLALGARFAAPMAVTIGTTAGMLVADGLAVFWGEKITRKIPMKWVRIFSCLLFIAFGLGIVFVNR